MDTMGVNEPEFFGTFKLRDDLPCFKCDPPADGIVIINDRPDLSFNAIVFS